MANKIIPLILLHCALLGSCEKREQSEENIYVNNPSEIVLEEIIVECINVLGKSIPQTYTLGNEGRYSRTISADRPNHEEITITLAADSGIVESCYITFFLTSLYDARQYHKQLERYLEKGHWVFVGNIDTYKLRTRSVRWKRR